MRLAASWFAWLADRHESEGLAPARRDELAAEVATGTARGWPVRAQRLLGWLHWILLIPVMRALPASWDIWQWGGTLLAYAVGLLLVSLGLHALSRRRGLRRLCDLVERQTTDSARTAGLLWAPAVPVLRRALERTRADLWARSRAVAWREAVVSVPEGGRVRPVLRYELAGEAAARAARDPLVRTLWRVGFVLVTLSPILLLLVGAAVLTSWWPLQTLGRAASCPLVALPVLLIAAEIHGRRLTRSFLLELLLVAEPPSRRTPVMPS